MTGPNPVAPAGGERAEVTSAGLAQAARGMRPVVLFVLLPLLIAVIRLDALDDRFETYGYDFRGTVWEPASNVLSGLSPYPSTADRASIASGNPSVYPPLPILAATPLALLRFDVALTIWTLLLMASVVVALLLVGVRDWRCCVLGLLCPPVVDGLFFANITLLLMTPLALAWRWRAHGARTGLAVAWLIAIKLVFVPLVVWLLLTRRLVAAAIAIAGAIALLVLPWAVIGFDGFREYPSLLDRLEAAYAEGTDSLPTALSWLASGSHARPLICLTAVLALVGFAALVRTRRDGDLSVFTAMIAASIVAVPIVWPHYLALLLVPLGIACPRPSAAWLLPYVMPLVLVVDDRTVRAACFILLALTMTAAPLVASRRVSRSVA